MAHSQQLNQAFQNNFPGTSSGFNHPPPATSSETHPQLLENGMPRHEFASRCVNPCDPYPKHPSLYLPKNQGSSEALKSPTTEAEEAKSESFPKSIIEDYNKIVAAENFSKMAADYSKLTSETNLNWNQTHIGINMGFGGLAPVGIHHSDGYSFPNIGDGFGQQNYGHATTSVNKYWGSWVMSEGLLSVTVKMY